MRGECETFEGGALQRCEATIEIGDVSGAGAHPGLLENRVGPYRVGAVSPGVPFHLAPQGADERMIVAVTVLVGPCDDARAGVRPWLVLEKSERLQRGDTRERVATIEVIDASARRASVNASSSWRSRCIHPAYPITPHFLGALRTSGEWPVSPRSERAYGGTSLGESSSKRKI